MRRLMEAESDEELLGLATALPPIEQLDKRQEDFARRPGSKIVQTSSGRCKSQSSARFAASTCSLLNDARNSRQT
jgi:hypothetical protein